MDFVRILLLLLGIIGVWFLYTYLNDALRRLSTDTFNPILAFAIGFITNFFDTLGIGSFATTTAMLKPLKKVSTKYLPGVLNVGHTIPIILQAFIFIQIIKVDILTLITLIVSSVIGSYVGAGKVVHLSLKKIKLYLGIALIFVALIIVLKTSGVINNLGQNNTSVGLTGIKLVLGNIIFFILGGLMALGVGLYAPAMAAVYLLGMNPAVAFPIMMSSCAFLMLFASQKFIKEKMYLPKLALFITLGGIPAVILAAYKVKSLPIDKLSYVVAVVIIIVSITYIYESIKMKD